MKFIFDTNVLLHYLRRSALAKAIDAKFAPFAQGNTLLLSIASIGEIRSISIQNQWGTTRLKELRAALLDFVIVGVNGNDLVERYAEIDAYSQGKLPGKKLSLTARNMGKNDLWIAATASLLDASLFTTDADFDHLKGVLLGLERITP